MIDMTRQRSSIRVVDDGVTSTVEVFGSLTISEKRGFERAMQKASMTSDGIILDLRGCSACDATALVAMIEYKRALESHLQVLVSRSGSVRRTFESCGLARKLSILEDAERAKRLVLQGL